MPKITKPSLMRNGDLMVLDAQAARAAFATQAAALVEFATTEADAGATFAAFERALVDRAFAMARSVASLFLAASETRVRSTLPECVTRGGRRFRRAPAQSRSLVTWFGLVRYERLYLREVSINGPARGFHPLDAELGLLADRVSPTVLSIGVRLATRMAFSEAREVLGWFLPEVPSTEVIEGAALGYGRHTQDWFTQSPPPEDDGTVLVIQLDSKGVPTATDDELRRLRGKRTKRNVAPSPRHRGRETRERRTRKPRRKKGDKSKNARMGTMVVMYTLRKQPGGNLLLGPINKRLHASFAPKRHSVEFARREASKRGLPPGTRRAVHILTDGDNSLAEYVAELEGAIKNIMCKRLDHGGMRWIKERAEAVLQLPCIDANGDWDRFARQVADGARSQARSTGARVRLQQSHAAALPKLVAA